ncbi:hypothetical protein DL96DRAFT_1589761 [Flagelloscypha sp. PMI_526]|nr:hypothetical protein DL96DRAFT_1589761 [Flagelloscypha sp. PMI_526]
MYKIFSTLSLSISCLSLTFSHRCAAIARSAIRSVTARMPRRRRMLLLNVKARAASSARITLPTVSPPAARGHARNTASSRNNTLYISKDFVVLVGRQLSLEGVQLHESIKKPDGFGTVSDTVLA